MIENLTNIGSLTIGERISILRKRAGMSRRELAEIIGVTSATILNYENSKTMPNIDTISRLSLALGVTMNMILHGCEPKKEDAPLL